MVNGMNGKNVRWAAFGIVLTILLALMEVHSVHISRNMTKFETAVNEDIEALTNSTNEDIAALTSWRDTWVNRVRELDATQSASIQFLKETMTEVRADLRGLKAQSRIDAAEFHRLLLDIRDRIPAPPRTTPRE